MIGLSDSLLRMLQLVTYSTLVDIWYPQAIIGILG
jgi:hypothetical protein